MEDLADALEWYQNISKTLGKKCLDLLQDKLELIQQFPDAFSVRYDNVRMAYLRKFPFAIHYMIDSDKIIVLRVLHTRRDPDNWKEVK